jgi:hypothetical protein
MFLRVIKEAQGVEPLAELVYREEDAREGNISNQRYFKTSEEARKTFLIVDLFDCIEKAVIFLEPEHLKACFNDY